MPLHYREHLPIPALRPYVHAYWTINLTATPDHPVPMRVLPDGCMDVIFFLSAPAPQVTLIGAMQQFELLRFTDSFNTLGVRFKPGGILPFVRAPFAELTDSDAALHHFWRDAGALWEQIASAPDTPARLSLLDSHLRRRLHHAAAFPDDLLSNALARINADPAATVRDLVRSLYVSERQFERRFKAQVGLSPKTFLRVVRFQRALSHVARQPVLTSLGYYDQSHLIRDFHALAGLPPSALRHDAGFVHYTHPIFR